MIRMLGSANGGWWVDTDFLTSGSVVIDGGVGMDVSFSHELIKLGCTVIGIDPSTVSEKYVRELGISGYQFILGAISHSSFPVDIYKNPVGSESCYPDHRGVIKDSYLSRGIALRDLINQYNPQLVKLDIEGAEYGCYHQCYGVKQVCIEFHNHCIRRFTKADTEKAIADFIKAGYQVTHRTSLEEVTFLYEDRASQ